MNQNVFQSHWAKKCIQTEKKDQGQSPRYSKYLSLGSRRNYKANREESASEKRELRNQVKKCFKKEEMTSKSDYWSNYYCISNVGPYSLSHGDSNLQWNWRKKSLTGIYSTGRKVKTPTQRSSSKMAQIDTPNVWGAWHQWSEKCQYTCYQLWHINCAQRYYYTYCFSPLLYLLWIIELRGHTRGNSTHISKTLGNF